MIIKTIKIIIVIIIIIKIIIKIIIIIIMTTIHGEHSQQVVWVSICVTIGYYSNNMTC